ncbi:MAG: SRPBCC domain-containing protein [Flavobacteriales bacterium]
MPTDTAHGNQVLTPAADEIRITRFFAAPRALVFQAWTDPLMLVQWFGCAAFTTTAAVADVRVGGQWRVIMRSPEGEDFPAYGTYLEVRAPERLRLTHHWEKLVAGVNPADHTTTVTVDLFEVEGGTHMEFRQTDLASEASRDSHIGGWCDSMDKLEDRIRR